MQHEPRCLLADLEIAVQPHRRRALEAGHLQVNRDSPLPHRNLRVRERRARLHAEVGATVRAPVRHRLVVRDLFGLGAAAVAAAAHVRPDQRLKPCGRCVLRGQAQTLQALRDGGDSAEEIAALQQSHQGALNTFNVNANFDLILCLSSGAQGRPDTSRGRAKGDERADGEAQASL